MADNDSNKGVKRALRIMLQPQLYVNARELCNPIPDSTICLNQGADAIGKALYKKEPLAVVSDVFKDFLNILKTQRNHTESVTNCESRFQVQLSRRNAQGSVFKISEYLIALAPLANADVDNNQKICVLANADARGSSPSSNHSRNDYVKAVSYEAITSVLRQCDKRKNSNGNFSSHALSSNAAHNMSHSGSSSRKPNSQGKESR